jgi:hypothetical protein
MSDEEEERQKELSLRWETKQNSRYAGKPNTTGQDYAKSSG